jgi:chromosome segregation ATPase
MPQRSQAQKSQLASITAKRVAATASAESEPGVKVLEAKLELVETQLSSTQTKLSSTKTQLSSTKTHLSSTKTQLSSTKDCLDVAQDQLHAEKSKYTAFYGCVRVERRKYQWTFARKCQLESQIKVLQSVGKAFEEDAAKAISLFDSTKSENVLLQHRLSTLMEKCAVEAQQTMQKADMLKSKLAASKKENRNLKQHCARIPEVKARAMK